MPTEKQDAFLGQLAAQIGPERLGPYLANSRGDALKALARYHWNIRLCQVYYPLLHALEVGLRNGLDRALVKQVSIRGFGQIQSWLDLSPTILRHPHAKEDLEKAKSKLLRKDPASGQFVANPRVGHSDLVAALSFGFWTGLLEDIYQHPVDAGGVAFWPVCEAQVFPGASGVPLSAIRARYTKVRQLRNRVFHHEPIWPKRPSDATPKEVYDQVVEGLRWLGGAQSQIPHRYFGDAKTLDEAHALPVAEEDLLRAIDGALEAAAKKAAKKAAVQAAREALKNVQKMPG